MKTGHLNEILKIYNTLTKEVTLNNLSKKILDIVMNKVKSEYVTLVVKAGGDYKALARCEKNKSVHFFEKSHFLMPEESPLQLFSYVENNPVPVVLSKTQLALHFKNDEYIQGQKPSMVCCVPLMNEEIVVGYLYLENKHAADSFAPESIPFLELLAPQMAVTLQNAVINQSLLATAMSGMESEEVVSKPVKHTREEQTTPDTENEINIRRRFEKEIQLLGEIGQSIAKQTSTENIIETVYEKVNSLMDAFVFDIGVLNEKERRIEFPGSIENGQKFPFNYYDIDEEGRLAVWCLKNEKEVVIGELHKEFGQYFPEREMPAPLVGETVQSLVYLPIKDRQKTIGVITVQSKKANAYSEVQVNLLKNLSVYVAIALENTNLLENKAKEAKDYASRTQKHEKQLEDAYQTVKLLGEVGQDITSNLSVERIIETVYENINNLMVAPLFSIGIYNENKNRIDVPATIENGEKLPAYYYDLEDSSKLSVFCFKSLREVIINNLEEDYPKYITNHPVPVLPQGEEVPNSVIFLPLIGKEGALGVVTVQSYEQYAYTDREINILRNLAIYVGIALDNALLYESLEEIVSERTSEIIQQKEEIEAHRDKLETSFKDVKLLSDIGTKLTASLSIKDISRVMYENINALMDVAAFGIGVLNPIKKVIEFKGALEDGQLLPDFDHSMKDDHRLSVWSMKNQDEVVITDFDKDIGKYLEASSAPSAGEMPSSLIYMPLNSQNRNIGVITVQSFQAGAYSTYHLNILRNLAVYTAIAIENADAYHKMTVQTEELQKTSQKVTSSIKYAKRIQNALLPNRITINNLLPDSFVLYKPKDIVSGDFFWFSKIGDKTFVAAVDCTGHGVPGAMMSIIGNDLLNEIVNVQGIQEPNEVLDIMHERITNRLNQHENDNRDGMDIAFCVIDRASNTLEFAGAKNPLIVVENGEAQIIKGDKMPIGGMPKDKGEGHNFTKHTIPISKDATYYIFSDGFQDQFGGNEGRKYLVKNFRNLLVELSSETMDKQRKLIRRELNNWMADQPNQTDDILVIGFRL